MLALVLALVKLFFAPKKFKGCSNSFAELYYYIVKLLILVGFLNNYIIGNQQRKTKISVFKRKNIGQILVQFCKKLEKLALSIGFCHILPEECS